MCDIKSSDLSLLIVDDDDTLRGLIAKQLSKIATVYTAADFDAATTLLRKNNVHIIFSDVVMPGGTGIDLLEWIKRHQSGELPTFVFITGFSSIENEEAIARGAYKVIAKPFRLSSLLQIAQEIAELKKLTPPASSSGVSS